MKRIETLKTLALVFFIAIGAAVSHAETYETRLARVNEAADQPCSHTVIFVSDMRENAGFTRLHADMS